MNLCPKSFQMIYYVEKPKMQLENTKKRKKIWEKSAKSQTNLTHFTFLASKVNRQVAWKKKRRRKKSMRFGGDFGLGGEGHSNSTRDDDEKCAGQQREKLDSDPWESREDEEEFGAF